MREGGPWRDQRQTSRGKGDDTVPRPGRMLNVPAAIHSKPLEIPARTQPSKSQHPAQGSTSSDEKHYERNLNSMLPSVAALLALKNSPQPRAQTLRTEGFQSFMEIESFETKEHRHSLSSSSPNSWSILQSPPDTASDAEDESVDTETDLSSLTSRSIPACISPHRSLSHDSFRSLDIDLDLDSSFSSTSPPDHGKRCKTRMRLEKKPSPSVPIANMRDHPLSITIYPECSNMVPVLTPITESFNPEILCSLADNNPPSTFKSNLTASFRMFKLAAKSLSAPSQFQNPATLSHSVKVVEAQKATLHFSPEGPSNKNIHTAGKGIRPPANIDALPFYLSNQLPAPRVKSSIQLQPYFASPLSTRAATAPPIFLPATNQCFDLKSIGLRDRQQRENSDFLRVVVLEMNMRRAGKLTGDGRARMWLGARSEKAIENKDIMSANGNSIADGAKVKGRVVLDGEVGEANEIENEEDRLWKTGTQHPKMFHRTYPGRGRIIPVRWVALIPD